MDAAELSFLRAPFSVGKKACSYSGPMPLVTVSPTCEPSTPTSSPLRISEEVQTRVLTTLLEASLTDLFIKTRYHAAGASFCPYTFPNTSTNSHSSDPGSPPGVASRCGHLNWRANSSALSEAWPCFRTRMKSSEDGWPSFLCNLVKRDCKHRHLLIRFQQLGSPDTTVGDIEAHRSGSTLQWFWGWARV